MKKMFLLIILLVIPFLVKAKVYNDFNASKVYTNEYISNFKNYSDYIVTDTQLYGYNGNIYFDIDFIKGGFLSREEFLISKDQNGSTYLFNGLNYWTMTKSNSQYYIVDTNSENNLKLLNSTEMSGARITEYVKSGTKIYGSGTYQDPWKFIEIKDIRITYNNNGGTGCTYKKVKQGNKYGTLCTPTKENYNFLGWFSDNSLTTEVNENAIITSDTDITINAKWQGKNYALTYNTNGGTTCSNKTVRYSEKYGTLCESKKAGYSFNGWYTQGTGGTKVDENTVVSGNLTVYAHWNACTAGTFNNGNSTTCSTCIAGTYSSSGASVCTNCTAGTYSSSGASVCINCPSGYTSNEGSTSQNQCYMSVSANKYIATANSSTQTNCATGYNKAAHTVYYGNTSSCSANTYTISYNTNGGSGTMSSTSCTYGSNCTLRSNSFSRTNYTFLGWSTSSTATSATYTNGSSVSNLTTTNGGIVTLYAVWQANYSCPNGGTLTADATNGSSSGGYICVTSANRVNDTCCDGTTREYYCTSGTLSGSTCTTTTSASKSTSSISSTFTYKWNCPSGKRVNMGNTGCSGCCNTCCTASNQSKTNARLGNSSISSITCTTGSSGTGTYTDSATCNTYSCSSGTLSGTSCISTKTASSRYVCTSYSSCYTYSCPSGWYAYSGSGSTLKCYKAASR